MIAAIRADGVGRWRVTGDHSELIGLITKEDENKFRVEMLMRHDVYQSSYERAVGFVFGVAAEYSKLYGGTKKKKK